MKQISKTYREPTDCKQSGYLQADACTFPAPCAYQRRQMANGIGPGSRSRCISRCTHPKAENILKQI